MDLELDSLVTNVPRKPRRTKSLVAERRSKFFSPSPMIQEPKEQIRQSYYDRKLDTRPCKEQEPSWRNLVQHKQKKFSTGGLGGPLPQDI